MTAHTLAALAQASVLQMRETLRRVTALQPTRADEALQTALQAEFQAGLAAGESHTDAWEETCIDVRRCHG